MTEYRGYEIVTDTSNMMKEIKAIGRGSVHKSLRGYYTTEKYAMKNIDVYENGKEGKDAETS